MKKFIVITSINKPTKSIIQLSKIKDWNLVVVGDKKTPSQYWNIPNCTYLSVEDQKSLGFKIHDYLPYNHYVRKNIGYLYAIKNGAALIWETDDDNILMLPSPSPLPLHCNVNHVKTGNTFVNIYQYFTKNNIWPRGLPLDEVRQKNTQKSFIKKNSYIPIQQGLADIDPDVDAIYRLTIAQDTIFNKNVKPIALPKNKFCPFNSQNTYWYKDAFWGLLIFGSVTPRVCDILRGYWVQRLLWELKGNLVFTIPTVKQERNIHNLMKDFYDEIPLYLQVKDIVDALLKLQYKSNDVLKNVIFTAKELLNLGIIKKVDLDMTKAWVQDLKNM